MSNDVERRVFVRVTIIPDEKNAQNASAIAAQVENAHKRGTEARQKAATAAEREAKRAADAEAREAKRAANEKQKQRDKEQRDAEKAYAAQSKAAEKAARDAERAFDREAAAAQKAYSRIMRERENQAKQLEALGEKQAAWNKQSAEGFKGALEGSLKMAKGFAQLGIASEDELEKIVKGLAKIEGGFNVLAGGIELYFKLSEGLKAFRQSAVAAAAAQELLNAAQARSGGAAAAGAVGTAGKAALAGAAGAGASAAGSAAVGAVAGGGGAAAAGGGVAAALGAKLAGLAAAAGLLLAKFVALPLAIVEVIQFFGRLAGFNTESFIGAVGSLFKARAAAAQSEKDVANSEKKRQQRQEIAGNLDANAQARDSLARLFEQFSAQIQGYNATIGGRQGESRSDIVAGLGRAQADSAAARATYEGTQAGGVRSRADIELTQTRVVEQQQRLAEYDRQRVEALRAQTAEQQAQVKAAQEQLSAAKAIVEQEKSRFETSLSKFGQLSKAEQERLRTISDKRKQGGSIDEQDAKFLQQVGFGGQLAEGVFAGKGRAAGGEGILAGLGERDALTKAEGTAAEAAIALDNSQLKLQQTTDETTAALDQMRESVKALQETLNGVLRFQAEQTAGAVAPQLPAGSSTTGAAGSGGTLGGGRSVDEAQHKIEELTEQNAQLAKAFDDVLGAVQTANADMLDNLQARRVRASVVSQAIG